MSSTPRLTSRIVAGVALLALTAGVFGPVVFAAVSDWDYTTHIGFAVTWMQTGRTQAPLPGFLFVALLIGLSKAIPSLGLSWTAFTVALSSYGFLAFSLWRMLDRGPLGDLRGAGARWTGVALPLALMLVMPIAFSTLAEKNLYFGYISINTYHNPSLVLLKPFAVLLFLYAGRALEGQVVRIGALVGAGLCAVLATLAKPNFTIALLPALLLTIPYYVLRRRRPNLTLLLAIVLPALGALAWQYHHTYTHAALAVESGYESKIVFAPFEVMRIWSSTGLAQKFALSLLFPACVYATHAREARSDARLNLAWLVFLLGAGCTYLLAETGPRLRHANFLWSAQIGLFILFAASLAFLVERAIRAPRRGPAFWLCAAVFALHLASGAVWYAIHLLHRIDASYPSWSVWL